MAKAKRKQSTPSISNSQWLSWSWSCRRWRKDLDTALCIVHFGKRRDGKTRKERNENDGAIDEASDWQDGDFSFVDSVDSVRSGWQYWVIVANG